MAIITGLHENLFREHYNFSHVTSEVDTLILKKNPTNIVFHDKMENHDGKGYILTTNLYKGAKYAALLVPNKRDLEGNSAAQTEGTTFNKQEQTTTKQLATQKIDANKIHVKLGHPKEDRMCVTDNHLHYRVKAMLEVLEYCTVVQINKK